MEMSIAAVWIWKPYTYVTACRSNLLYFYTEDVDINFLRNTHTHAHIYASYPSTLKHSHLRDGATLHNNRNIDPTAGASTVQNRNSGV